MDQDANAGILATDPAYVDTREGTFYWDMTQVCALEIVRLWDAIGSETVAAAFPSVAWGDYLDEHGNTFALTRNPAVAAVAVVRFTGASSTLIPTNTQMAAYPADPSQDTIVFQTVASGSTCPQLLPPAGVSATPSGTGGTLTPSTYIYHVTAYNAFGETTGSFDAPATVGTATGSVALAWTPVTNAVGYRVYRTLVPNTPGNLVVDQNISTFTDIGSVTPSTGEPTQNTTSGVLLGVVAVVPGAAGNLGPGAISTLQTLLPGINTLTNPLPATGGTDVESDDAFRLRILGQYQGQGAGNIADYVRWSLAIPGVERVWVLPTWAGPGTVLVVVMIASGAAVTSTVVTAVQIQLDPVTGQGHGQAPVGAAVTVVTSAPLAINVVAQVAHAPGFSLDGAGGTIATRAQIQAGIAAYLMSLNPGDTVIFQRVLAAFFTVTGVQSVPALTVNGGSTDIVLSVTGSPQMPYLALPVLS